MKVLNLNEAGIISILNPLRRKLMLWKSIIFMSITFGIILLQLLGGNFILGGSSGKIFFVGFILLIGFSMFSIYQYRISKKQYTNTYKKLLAERVLRACFDDARYTPDQGFSREEFTRAGVFSVKGHGFSYNAEDLITGKQSGVEFKQSDVKITHRSGGRNRRTVVDVDGRLTRFQYNKNIMGRILITSKGFFPVAASSELYMFGNGKDVLYLLQNGLGIPFKVVSMEDVDFNQRFTVYATDDHSAFYLLTPPFMEYIKKLSNMDQKLSISFDGTSLYILRAGKGGIFVPPEEKGLNITDEVNKSYQELQEIVRCIDILRLDDRQEREELLNEEQMKTSMSKGQMRNEREEQLYRELKEAGNQYSPEDSQEGDEDFEGIGWSKF